MSVWTKLFNNWTWHNKTTATDTPLSAANLQKINDAIDGIDDRAIDLNTRLDGKVSDGAASMSFNVAADTATAISIENENSGNGTYIGMKKIDAADTAFELKAQGGDLNLTANASNADVKVSASRCVWINEKLFFASALPTASSTYAGKICFVLEDQTNYDKGTLWECVSNGSSYSWQQISSSGGNYMEKGVDYVTAGKSSSVTLGTGATAEGTGTGPTGNYAHAEGHNCGGSGNYGHSEGDSCQANGAASHAEGFGTVAGSNYQHVQGKWNVTDSNNTYAHIVGGGDLITPANIHTLDWNGNGWFAGDVKVGPNSDKLAKENELAPAFSTSTAYTVGAYVTYNGDLYRCTTAHAAGAWNSSHFTQVSVGEELNGRVIAGDPITVDPGSDSAAGVTMSNDNSGNSTYYKLNGINAADTGFAINSAGNLALSASGTGSDISLTADDEISITGDTVDLSDGTGTVHMTSGDIEASVDTLYISENDNPNSGNLSVEGRVDVSGDIYTNGKVAADGNITSPTISAITDNLGSKNLLKVTAETQTVNGVTFTVNRNAQGECTSITANGTATGDNAIIALNHDVFKLPTTGTVMFDLKSSVLSDQIYGQLVVRTSSNVWNRTMSQKSTSAISVVLNNEILGDCNIVILQGTTVSNATFYPMVYPVGVPSNYVPYTHTNRLITAAMDIDASMNATFAANIVAEGTVTANGSDYAENFPALENCPVCRFVTLDGEGIRLADGGDYILGVTSEAPSMIGDKDVDGVPVGLLGKLWVEHDGSARVNGFVVCGRDGIATASDSGYRVMAVSGGKCRILVK